MSIQENNLKEFCGRLLTELQNRSGSNDEVTLGLLKMAKSFGFTDDFANERAGKPGPTVHVVTTLVSGYAREDASTSRAVGAYTDPELARKVAQLCGFGSSAHAVELNVVPAGIKADAEVFGIKLIP